MCEVIKLGENVTAIVCGRNLTHTCNERLHLLLLSDGNRVEDTPANRFKYENDVFITIVGGSLACDICGHALIDDAWKM